MFPDRCAECDARLKPWDRMYCGFCADKQHYYLEHKMMDQRYPGDDQAAWRGQMLDREIYAQSVKDKQKRAKKQRMMQARYELEQAKQRRLDNAVEKECPECEVQDALHDEGDYLCIKCRDGESAFPSDNWQYGFLDPAA